MNKTRIPFPEHLQLTRSLLPDLLSILEDGRTNDWYSFVWLEETKSLGTISAVNENTSESLDRGLVLRIMVEGQSFEKSTNILDHKSLIELAKSFRSEIDQLYPNSCKPSFSPVSWSDENRENLGTDILDQLPKKCEVQTEVHFSPLCRDNPFNTKIISLKNLSSSMRKELLEKSKNLVKENDQYEELAEIKSMARQQIITNVFVDREKNMSQTLPITLLYSMGMTKTGQIGRSISGGLGGLEIAVHSEYDKEEAYKRPLQLANAKKLTPGRYKVISGPDVTGVIAHEAFGHTQEGDTWMKGRSIAKDLHESKTKVGNDQASIVNYPNMFSMEDLNYGTNGSYFFDHEGELARPQVILDKGMLSSPMTDLTSALRLNVPRTANGKRESWRRPLMTRQTNTYFTPGDKTLTELIAMVSDGFLARWASGGMEDPKGGSLTAGTSYLEEIKDGKLTGAIFLGPAGGHIELSDPVFTLLDRIIAKSKSTHEENVPENKFGGCGKYHKEGVAAGCGGPYILWASINCG
jgi:predicted Zn-dependent protease